jgi:hypothetical protein
MKFQFSEAKTLEINTLSAAFARPKTSRLSIAYWIATVLFAALMLVDGIAGLSLNEEGKQAMALMGYPAYIMTILGVCKILGAVALVQTRSVVLKEWAYAGFAFNFLGASVSWYLAGQGLVYVGFPLVAFALLMGTYALWKMWNR